MASVTYNTGRRNVTHVYQLTGGGINQSVNLVGTAFDYFEDNPTVDDAIYFHLENKYLGAAGLEIDVATAMAGTDIVLKWEYFAKDGGNKWQEIPRVTDNTNDLTTTGANLMVFFPYPPFWYWTLINGVEGFVVRCRIDSFTAVTEGGANTDDTPQFGDGYINLVDYAEESPCTLEDIYDYMTANYPDVDMKQLGTNDKEFELAHAYILPGDSFWKMENEVLRVNNGSSRGVNFDGRNFTDGVKIGDDEFRSGSKIIFTNYRGALSFVSNANTKMYGTQISLGSYTETIDGVEYTRTPPGGYFGPRYGEYIGVSSIGLGTGYWNYPLTMKNCFFYIKNSVTSPFISGNIFENVHLFYADETIGLITLYSGAQTGEMINLNWSIPSGYLFGATSLGDDAYQWNFLNPSPAFPDIGDTPDYMNPTYNDYAKNWHIYERYTLDLRVVDFTGTEISGATVTIVDKDGTAVSGSPFTTDASGDITQAKCLKSHGYYDGEVKKDEYNPYTITISKSGYKTRAIKYPMDRKREEIEMLERYTAVESVIAIDVVEGAITGDVTEEAISGEV